VASLGNAPRFDLDKNGGQNAPGKGTAQPEIFLTLKSGSEELSEPSFDIAGGGNELILEIHLCESFVAGASQAVAAH
jgi:hypothetical protein